MKTNIDTWERQDIKDWSGTFSRDKYTMYAIFSERDELLYVGYTFYVNDTIKRFSTDLNKAQLWSEAHSIALKELKKSESARDLRRALIQEHRPRFNYIGHKRARKRSMSVLKSGLYLYQYSNAYGQLVYVGITKDIKQRTNQHKKYPWYSADLKLRIKLFTVAENARDRERCLIGKYRPSGNTQHTGNGFERVA